MKHFTPKADKEEDFFYLLDGYFERMNCVDDLTELDIYGWFDGPRGKGINVEVARCVKSTEKPHCKEPSEIDTFLATNQFILLLGANQVEYYPERYNDGVI